MSQPIQRQSEQFGIFDDGPRFARERPRHELPAGLAGMLSGPRIQAGLLNTRQAADVQSGGNHADDMRGLYGPGRDFGRDGGPAVPPDYYVDDTEPEEADEFGLDPERYLPEKDIAEWERLPFDTPTHFPGGGYDDFDPNSPENADARFAYQRHLASFCEARPHTAEGGPTPGLFNTMLFMPGDHLDPRSILYGEEEPVLAPKLSFGPMPQQQAIPMSPGHGYVPGHRVGLPWRERVIPGTVTHLNGQQVGIRWDDGQHSTEESSDLRPL